MDYTKYTAEDFASNDSFIQYFLKETPQDIFFWEQWIDEHPEKYKEVTAARKLLEVLSLGLPQPEFDEEIRKMKGHVYGSASLENYSLKISPQNIKPGWRFDRIRLIKIAAVVAFTVVAGAAILLLSKKSNVPSSIPQVEELIVKRNSKGQKSLIQLPDGSIISLNSSSEVRFYESFPNNIREIELKGEAFFEVAPDSLKPFIVKTEDMQIKALGTSFNVRAYGETETLRISLVTGKIEVNLNENVSDKSILTPGEGLSFDKKSKQITKGKFDPNFTLAWRKGIIYFKNASWNQIIITLERWYNVQFEIKNQSKLESPYTGQFDNQSLELVLESLSFSKNFKYKIDGKKITINFSQQP